MSRVASVLLAGEVLEADTAEQLRRWGMRIEPPDELAPPLEGPVLRDALEQALQDELEPGVFVTDPALEQRYVRTQEPAELFVVTKDESLRCEVVVGRHLDGSWLIPWNGEDMTDLLTNGESALVVRGTRYYFGEVLEFHCGPTKTFLRCFASTVVEDP